MARQRRADWYEWDGEHTPEEYILACDTWTADTETIMTALRETGWFVIGWHAMAAAEDAELVHAWYGYLDGDPTPCICDEHGRTEDGTPIDGIPIRVTLAYIDSVHVL